MMTTHSLARAFREKVREYGDKDAVVFVRDPDDQKTIESWTYRRLDEEARSVAAHLTHRGLRGARVLLLYPSGLRFIAAYLGCLYAGAIAVPAPLPVRSKQQKWRITAIVKDADVAAVLAQSDDRAVIDDWLSSDGLPEIMCVYTDAPGPTSTQEPGAVETDASEIAFLQYTSGSTGDPKGVVLTQENVVHNVRTCFRLSGLTESELRVVSWLPLYHDMGLIGAVLVALLNGGTCVLLDPLTFIRRPHFWLRTIDRFRGTLSNAPNFAYALCVDRIKDEELARLDLSSWWVTTNGSDWLEPSVMRRFVDRFSVCGFREEVFCPAYGLAEATLVVTGRRSPALRVLSADRHALDGGIYKAAERAADAKQIVSCGPPLDIDIEIVDPVTSEPLSPDHVGEIWLRGRSVAKGYWARADQTRETFGAVTAGNDGPYLRTGDLGFIHGGELYVTGRIKEVIVVHGQKVYPQDIEFVLRAEIPELSGRGAVCCLPRVDNEPDKVLVIHEVKLLPTERLKELAEEAVHIVGRDFGAQVASMVFLPPGGVQQTTSGKTKRLEMRDRYLAGTLEPIYEYTR
jgi:acyl-CoA synthetase (AMP-forming)/AMP-acid ligase II